MIVFDMICCNGHQFEGWFSSAKEFTKQKNNKQLSCPICASCDIKRQLSAPRINKIKEDNNSEKNNKNIDKFLAIKKKVLEHIVKNTEDVGKSFPEIARKIHYNEIPEKSIRGSASKKDIDELQEEGIDVISLPLNTIPPGNAH